MAVTIVYLRAGVLNPKMLRRVSCTLCRNHAKRVSEMEQEGKAIITTWEPSPGEECDDCYADDMTAQAAELQRANGWAW